MEVLQVFLAVVALISVLPVAFYCLEVVAGCWPARPRQPEQGQGPRVAVLVPAHNEAAGIGNTIESIQSQLSPTDRLLVIADNCTDGTAEQARRCGATVCERSDDLRRGKGFALAYGLNELSSDPPDVVLFFDADCRLAPGTVTALAGVASREQRPVQSLNLCEPTAQGSAQQRLSGLAFRFKNLIRMTGISRLGGPCHLTGTGMGLPWKLVDQVPWATGNVVEDMQLGIDFALAGHSPVFVPDAKVLSDLPTTSSGLLAQRRRWEHGFLETALTQIPQIAAHACERRSWSLVVLACDFAIPPLALLSLGLVAAWLLSVLVWLVGLGSVPLLVFTFAIGNFAGATLLGWFRHCRDVVPLRLLLDVPMYVFAKLPLYLDFITRRQRQWVRAERH